MLVYACGSVCNLKLKGLNQFQLCDKYLLKLKLCDLKIFQIFLLLNFKLFCVLKIILFVLFFIRLTDVAYIIMWLEMFNWGYKFI